MLRGVLGCRVRLGGPVPVLRQPAARVSPGGWVPRLSNSRIVFVLHAEPHHSTCQGCRARLFCAVRPARGCAAIKHLTNQEQRILGCSCQTIRRRRASAVALNAGASQPARVQPRCSASHDDTAHTAARRHMAAFRPSRAAGEK